MYKRIVIKLSGEALAEDISSAESTKNIFHEKTINDIVCSIKNVMKKGTQVSLVVGGGNIWRGRYAKPEMDRTKADQIGMLATVINSIYLADVFRRNNIKAIVMTPFIVATMTEQFSKEKALEYMEKGYIVIFAGGVGHPFFSTDTIPALRAAELEADCVLFAKNVDGIYDKDPSQFKDAIRYKEITYRKVIKDNLVANDITAMILCENNNIESLVFALNYPKSIELACEDSEEFYKFGTKIVFNNEEDYYVK